MTVSASNRRRYKQIRLRLMARTLGRSYRVLEDVTNAVRVELRALERYLEAESSSDEEDQSQLFEVERVLAHNAADRTYLVRWSDRWSSPRYDSWEPVENFIDGERNAAIVAYHDRDFCAAVRRAAAAANAAAGDECSTNEDEYKEAIRPGWIEDHTRR
jgi:hypothetical protein